MFSLEELLGQQQGNTAIDQISQQVGAQPSLVNSAISMALPALINGLANNASSPAGAESLNNAVEQDHSGGGILDNLGGLGSLIFGGQQQAAPPKQADSGGILEHILGGSQGPVTEEISSRSGLNIGQVAQILMFLAPIVMGFLGRKKEEENLDAGGLSNWLGGQQQEMQSSGNPMIDIASSMLDRDRDGSAVDDIASMAFNYIRGK